jgi:heavy metal translocating P-type ATPase
MNTSETKIQTPYPFDDFFDLGLKEEQSPFLMKSSRKWGINLNLKASLLALFFLLVSFILSFYTALIPLSHIFLIGVYFLAGIPALIEAIKDLMDFDINIDILMTVAAFSSVLIGSGMEGGLLLVLFSLSGSMEDAVSTKAKSAISSLHKLSPAKATVVEEDGSHIERSIKDIDVGTIILVKASSIVPLDGIVINGISTVNLVHLTGESFPIIKKVGDDVAAGARNLEGAITLKVTNSSANSTLSKIIDLVTEAQEAKPKLQRFFDQFSSKYAMSIILASAFFAITFPYILHIPFLGFEGSLYRALSFLIAASPCALIIAIPIAYLSAVSVCAKKGILIKGGVTLDALAKCKILALDKTGTVTTGDLEIISITPLNDIGSVPQALSIAYALEKNAVHPIAKAIIAHAKAFNAENIEIKNFNEIPGQGLNAELLDGTQLYIGRPDFIASNLEAKEKLKLLDKTAKFLENGELVACLAVGKSLYLFSFQDNLRPDMKKSIDALKKNHNLKIVMLTGDHKTSARKIAEKLGIEQYYADLNPENKLDLVSKLSQNHELAMVGDGVNDAPALARASVGICMGKLGSGAAVDAADVVLLHDNIEYLDWLFEKSNQTTRIVKQNLFIALSAIAIASIPALGGYIPLWLAVVMHEGGTVLVGLNALRLLRK